MRPPPATTFSTSRDTYVCLLRRKNKERDGNDVDDSCLYSVETDDDDDDVTAAAASSLRIGEDGAGGDQPPPPPPSSSSRSLYSQPLPSSLLMSGSLLSITKIEEALFFRFPPPAALRYRSRYISQPQWRCSGIVDCTQERWALCVAAQMAMPAAYVSSVLYYYADEADYLVASAEAAKHDPYVDWEVLATRRDIVVAVLRVGSSRPLSGGDCEAWGSRCRIVSASEGLIGAARPPPNVLYGGCWVALFFFTTF